MEDYLRTLVGFYPVSSQQDSVQKLVEYVQARCNAAGLHTKVLQYNGVYNLFASTSGNRKAKVLLQAHIDVVPGSDQPFRATAEKFEGRGTYDMLYATAGYLRLLDELGDNLGKLDLAIMLSGDEELGGFNGAERMLADGYGGEICVLPDAGEGFGSLNVAAKGILHMAIRIKGRAHHGARPWEGDGAAAKLVRCLYEAEQLFDPSSKHNSTMTVAILQAGEAINKGPAQAEASLDIRYKDKQDLARINKGLKALLKQYNGEIVHTMTGDDYQLDVTQPLAASFIALYERHNGGPLRYVKAHGSSDARFFSAQGTPVIMLRPDGGGAHGDQEWISRPAIEKWYALIKEYVLTTATIGDI